MNYDDLRRKPRHSVWRQRLNRRTFLRGTLAGTSVIVGLPLLDIMLDDHGTALADGGPLPVRFGVFYWGGGIVHSTWVPTETGPVWTMPDSIQPFADLAEYVTVVTGTNHTNSSPGHIPARGIALSSSHDPDTSIDGVGTWRGQNHPEPTVDSIVSGAWSGNTPFPSVEISITQKGPYKNNSSWQAGGQVYNRHEPSPYALFDRLFGMGVPTDDPDVFGASKMLQKSMLDAVMADAQALSAKLGANDRMRIEQHIDGLRAIEHRLEDFTNSCAQPDAPVQMDFGDGGSNEQKEAKNGMMVELLATALACDLTRVFSYEWSATQSEAVYWEVGVTEEHHQLTHDDPGGDRMQQVTRFIMKNYAQLAQALADKAEGTGNVLDNTLILGTSEHATAGNHDYTDHPFLLVGKAGGGFAAGIHHRDPNPDANANAPKVLLTAVRAVGVQLESLGQVGGPGGVADRVVTDSIPELLT